MSFDADEKVGLMTLMGGLAVERFDDELQNVLDNIVDPNTPALAKRSITLTLSFKPDKNRGMGAVELAVVSKLAPAEKAGTMLFISQTRTGPVATEHNPRQPQLPMSDTTMKVVPFAGQGGKN